MCVPLYETLLQSDPVYHNKLINNIYVIQMRNDRHKLYFQFK